MMVVRLICGVGVVGGVVVVVYDVGSIVVCVFDLVY